MNFVFDESFEEGDVYLRCVSSHEGAILLPVPIPNESIPCFQDSKAKSVPNFGVAARPPKWSILPKDSKQNQFSLGVFEWANGYLLKHMLNKSYNLEHDPERLVPYTILMIKHGELSLVAPTDTQYF